MSFLRAGARKKLIFPNILPPPQTGEDRGGGGCSAAGAGLTGLAAYMAVDPLAVSISGG